MKDYEALSYCGIFCEDCANYKKNMNCKGCRNEAELLEDCPTRACAAGRGLPRCGNCGDFPCAELNGFYNDGDPFHLTAFRNMRGIMESGVGEWLENRRETV